jgi:hypothetical protein
MTKPKNPYKLQPTRTVWDQGYAAGLRDREKLLARALRRLMRRQTDWSYVSLIDLDDFLTARAKKRRGR